MIGICGKCGNHKWDKIVKDGKTLEYCVRNTADVDEAIDIIYRQSVRVKQEELKNKASENA